MEEENFLKNKFNSLHTSPEVISAIKRREKRGEEKISQKPVARIENYLNRFLEILNKDEPEDKKRGVEAFKKILFKNNIISEKDIPERVYKLEQEIAFNQGHGEVIITEYFKQEKNKQIIAGQKESLSSWIDYLSSDDAMYLMWAKYWVLQSVLKVGRYNKKRKSFDKRGKHSVAPFPPMNAGAVAKSIAVIQEKIKGGEIENFSNLENTEFQRVLSKKDFSKIYALVLESLPEFSEEGLENIKGEWVIYKQIPHEEKDEQGTHTQVQHLFDSLQGYPLEWCTAQNIDTAKSQLKGGDFYVYYSEDDKGNNKIPRVAIRMNRNSIAEVRGIDIGQEMDRFILPVVEEKMNKFGEEGKLYKKKALDMKVVTAIFQKREEGEVLSIDEIIFILELEGEIMGFGYKKDPRINDIINSEDIGRDLKKIIKYKNSDEFTLALVHKLIKDNTISKRGDIIINNLKSFILKEERNNEYEEMNIVPDNNSIKQQLHSLKGKIFEQDISNILIENGYGGSVAMNIDKFRDSNHESIALSLISANKSRYILDNSRKFSFAITSEWEKLFYSGDAKIRVDALINKRYHKKDDAQRKEILRELFMRGGGSIVGYNLEKMLVLTGDKISEKAKNFNNEVASKFIELGMIDYVINNIKFFKNLSAEVFIKMQKKTNSIMFILNGTFDSFDLNGKMIDVFFDDALLSDKNILELTNLSIWKLEKFQVRDHKKIIKNILKSQEGGKFNGEILANIIRKTDFLQSVTNNEIIMEVIKSGYNISDLRRYIGKFNQFGVTLDNLDIKVASEILKTRGGHSFVAHNLESFNKLTIKKLFTDESASVFFKSGVVDPEMIEKIEVLKSKKNIGLSNEIALEFIKIGRIDLISTNIKIFQELQPEIAILLMKETNGHNIIFNNLEKFSKMDEEGIKILKEKLVPDILSAQNFKIRVQKYVKN